MVHNSISLNLFFKPIVQCFPISKAIRTLLSLRTHIQKITELVGKINSHNKEAALSGGIVIACGMSEFNNDNSVADVFERADMIMYENKIELKGGDKSAVR